jgi:hypothetical protein
VSVSNKPLSDGVANSGGKALRIQCDTSCINEAPNGCCDSEPLALLDFMRAESTPVKNET